MHGARGLALGLVVGSLILTGLVQPRAALAAEPDPQLTATLDGKPIPLEDVGKYSCDDYDYPHITCWSTRQVADSRALVVSLLTAVDYVSVWDLANYAGAFMNISQDYATLVTIGWNDKISSFKARNSETGTFYFDWFYGGTWYAFCCNTQVGNLGAYSNQFSSVIRT